MKKLTLKYKLLLIISFLFIFVFFAQFLFQNLFFNTYYKNRQTRIVHETMNEFMEAFHEGRLTKEKLDAITNNKILLGYVDQQLTPLAGNLFNESTITIKTEEGQEYTINTKFLPTNAFPLPIGSIVKAHVYQYEGSNKYYASSIGVTKVIEGNSNDAQVEIVDNTLYEIIGEGQTFSYDPQNMLENIKAKENFEVTGELIGYSNPSPFDFDHTVVVTNHLFIEPLESGTKVVNGKERYLITIQAADSGYIIGSVSLAQSDEIISILNSFNVYILLFTLVLVVFGIMHFSHRIVQPILKMQKAAQSIAKQDFTQHIHIQTGDELEELANALNSISNNLEEKIKTLESYNDKLKREFEERLEIEKNQKNLLMNISHDLKTPLTVIKGYLKAIKDGVYDNDQYIDITIESVDDVNHIISEMIELTKYRSPSHQLSLEEVDLTRLIYRTYNDLFYLSKNREQQVKLDIVDDVFIKADKKAMKKVLDNIMLNAIEYSPEGAQITITLIRANNGCELIVKNEGVFIGEEDLKHIFEAFYRVDKSRKESVQGNGLGLSIVKIILDQHGYPYKIGNTDTGVQFKITIGEIMS